MNYIGVGDFFLIAAATLERSVSRVRWETNLALLYSALDPPQETIDGVEVFPSVVEKAAVLCIRIARNRPLRDGNTAVAYAAMREFLGRNGAVWNPPSDGAAEVASICEAMAAERITEAEFMLWVNERVT